MPRYARKTKTLKKRSGARRTYRKRFTVSRYAIRSLSRRISAVNRRVAGEVCKFEITPDVFANSHLKVGTAGLTEQHPLSTITSGTPWIMPLNWTYQPVYGNPQGIVWVDGEQLVNGQELDVSLKNPIWYNCALAESQGTLNSDDKALNDVSPGLQYRLKYFYINALFNASISDNYENTDGALRIVIVKDKQPTGGAATWADSVIATNSRGVFNANRIDAQLNPNTVGRFKIMYDKTLRFTRMNGYKPFKYYKQLSTVVRNNRDLIPASYFNGSIQEYNANINQSNGYQQSSASSPPVQKNAFYLMIFSDGPSFTYTSEGTTGEGKFHLFHRVAYYNN